MALTALSKVQLRTRVYDVFGEASGGLDFTGTFVNTALDEAQQEYAMRSRCLVGSARRTRPSTAGGKESILTLPTGAFEPWKVVHLRHAGAGTAWRQIRKTTERELALREGETWVNDVESGVGTSPEYHAWYVKSATQIGFYPPRMTATAGTALLWYFKVPDQMTATASCTIPPQFCPGVVYIAARKCCERDVNSDAAQKRAAQLEVEAERYVQMALVEAPIT